MCAIEALERLARCERPRVVVGDGALSQLGALCSELGVGRALLVSDRGLVDAGHTQRAEKVLASAGIEATLFSSVSPNPSESNVQACALAAGEAGVDFLVGLGGGSAMDTAKGATFLLAGGGQMEDYWGRGKGRGEFMPLVMVPTTAGTGSEMQSFALITRERDGRKMACGDERAIARIVILDPELTASVPPEVAAHAGLDCLTHAVETAVTSCANPQSLQLSHLAFQLVCSSFSEALKTGALDARRNMLVAASLAGLAIEGSMLGAAHALANPLTARVGLDHGRAVATMLPHVVRFNAQDPGAAAGYEELCRATAIEGGSEGLAIRIEAWLDEAGVPRGLGAAGIADTDLGTLAEAASQEWTGGFNPRPVDASSLQGILQSAL
ncbi:alcohol dehydrogenase [Candidatus Woesearchaeota archaeon]|jgi:alcohol dehydrogenase|nr:alcohol dehydrogenase [Candidatus Woesearchaeota archaeon]MDP6740076.1 iron-containing alcohol dehydrogenase [Planctomycetota bacterium]MDP6939192.1 iron-containing alcohol dehydrogenase [Planctomycetota bacterium]